MDLSNSNGARGGRREVKGHHGNLASQRHHRPLYYPVLGKPPFLIYTYPSLVITTYHHLLHHALLAFAAHSCRSPVAIHIRGNTKGFMRLSCIQFISRSHAYMMMMMRRRSIMTSPCLSLSCFFFLYPSNPHPFLIHPSHIMIHLPT